MSATSTARSATASPAGRVDNPKRTPLDPIRNEPDAAAYLGKSRTTLRQWRYRGVGPTWIRTSTRSVAYRQSALDAWIDHCTRQPARNGAPTQGEAA